jgi:hypothetical protein
MKEGKVENHWRHLIRGLRDLDLGVACEMYGIDNTVYKWGLIHRRNFDGL